MGKISRRKCKEAIARAQNEADFLIGGVHTWKVLQTGGAPNLPDVRFLSSFLMLFLFKILNFFTKKSTVSLEGISGLNCNL
jgi:hypothetical protein